MSAVVLDSSVLVAALWAGHPHHRRGRAAVVPGGPRAHLAVCAHALAETWATLSALPIKPRLQPLEARALVVGATEGLQVIEVSATLQWRAIDRCARLGLRSGAVYDAIHLVSAEHVGAEALLTLNVADFARLDPVGVAIREP